MRQILYVNPTGGAAKKKKKRAKPAKKAASKTAPKKGKTMAKKRKGKKPGPKKNPVKKRGARRKGLAKRAGSSVRRSFTGLNFRAASKNIIPTQLGMFAAVWGAKRFPGFGGEATQTNPESWGYQSYIKGSITGVLAGMAANVVKSGSGQKVLEGALNLMVFELIQNEFVQGSEWASGQFGQDGEYFPQEYLMTGTDEYPQMYGQDGNVYPADERHRLPEVEMEGMRFAPVGPLGGSGALRQVGPLGATDPWAEALVT